MTHPMTDERLAELRAAATFGRLLRRPSEDVTFTEDDFGSLSKRLRLAEEEIQVARRERSILMDVVGSLTEEQLSSIPEGKLLLALQAMDDADKAKDYHTFVDGLVAEVERCRCTERDRFVSIATKLTAAEALIREVAQSGVEFDDHRLNWVAAQIGRDTFAKCRSYLR